MQRTETFSKHGFLEEMALEWSLKNQEGLRRVKWSREENSSPGERKTEAWRSSFRDFGDPGAVPNVQSMQYPQSPPGPPLQNCPRPSLSQTQNSTEPTGHG